MERPRIAPHPFHPGGGPAADWMSALRAYLHEDWLTTGIAEYLDAQAESATAAQPLPCMGCGRHFPRADLWVHQRFGDVAYCDTCYYRRFGRQAD
jgi:hypothetical protein